MSCESLNSAAEDGPSPSRRIYVTEYSTFGDGPEGKDGRPFKCAFCKETFNSELLLYTHMKREHPVEDQRGYVCPYCGIPEFLSKEHLEIHLNNQHQIYTNKKEDLNEKYKKMRQNQLPEPVLESGEQYLVNTMKKRKHFEADRKEIEQGLAKLEMNEDCDADSEKSERSNQDPKKFELYSAYQEESTESTV